VKIVIFTLFAFATFSYVADGGQILLEGTLQQGALILGNAPANTRISINNRTVKIDKNGAFLFGLGRDHPRTLIIKAVYEDGSIVSEKKFVQQREYQEQHINNLPEQMVTPPQDVMDRISQERNIVRAARSHYTAPAHVRSGLIWPTVGPITGVFGSRRILNGKPRSPHFGIDIAAPLGENVRAMTDGVIRLASELYLSGNTVIIDHGHGVTSSYLHMDSILVSIDENIKKGQIIGHVGATGRTTGPHLDWRVNWLEVRLDPNLVAKLLNVSPNTN